MSVLFADCETLWMTTVARLSPDDRYFSDVQITLASFLVRSEASAPVFPLFHALSHCLLVACAVRTEFIRISPVNSSKIFIIFALTTAAKSNCVRSFSLARAFRYVTTQQTIFITLIFGEIFIPPVVCRSHSTNFAECKANRKFRDRCCR